MYELFIPGDNPVSLLPQYNKLVEIVYERTIQDNCKLEGLKELKLRRDRHMFRHLEGNE